MYLNIERLLVFSFLLGWILYFLAFGFPGNHDDAFIVFVYVRNFLEGNGLVFNLDDHVWGFTSPLYTLLVSALGLLHRDLPEISFYLGLATYALSALLLGKLCRHILPHPLSLIVVAAFLSWWRLLYWLQLESSLLLLLQLSFVLSLLEKKTSQAAFIGSLSCLTRPDSIILVVPLLLWNSTRTDIKTNIVLFATPGILWVSFAYFYYGSILPQPFYAKREAFTFVEHFSFASKIVLGTFRPPRTGFENSEIVESMFWPIVPLLLLTVCASLWNEKFRKNKVFIYLIPYPWILLSCYSMIGPEVVHTWEYASSVFFFKIMLLVGAAHILYWIYQALLYTNNKTSVNCFFIVAGLLSAHWCGLELSDGKKFIDASHTLKWRGARDKTYMEISEWMKDNLPSDSSLLAAEVGTLAYHSRFKIVDVNGLVTKIPHASEEPLEYIYRTLKPSHVLRFTHNDNFNMPYNQPWEPSPGIWYKPLKDFPSSFYNLSIYVLADSKYSALRNLRNNQ